MMAVLETLFLKHDLWLVGVAAAICALSSYAGMALLQRARRSGTRRRLMWIGVAAAAVGFGIWSTHFVAMLAYAPGFAVGYHIPGTLLSLLVAIVVTGLGFTLASWGRKRSDFILGGIVVGFGITGMHYLGMNALHIGGAMEWDSVLVVASVLFASGLGGAAVMIGATGSDARRRLVSAGLLTLGIVLLHFTAMGAADLSNCFAVVATNQLNVGWLASAVTFGSALIVGSGIFALYLDTRDAKRGELESQRLHSLADAALEGLVMVKDDRVTGTNAAFANLSGLDRDELPGTALGDLIDPNALKEARSAHGHFVETTLLTSTRLPVEIVSRRANLAAGDTEVLSVRDITDRLRREEESERAHAAIAESEKRFRFLIQSVTDYAIYMLDPEGRVVNWNAGAERNKGYKAEEIIGKNFAQFFSLQDQEDGKPQGALAAALAGGKFQDEGWRHRKDGSRFWAQVILEPIYDDAGQHMGFAKITRDVTRQREDAERVATARSNLELSLAHMSQGLALFGADERIVVANRRLNEILGIPVQISIAGLGLHDLAKFLVAQDTASAQDIDNIYEVHRALVAGLQGGEIVQEFPGGKTVRIVHRPASEGAWVTTFEDISERRRSEQQILFMAHHDGLTGLPNRGSFTSHLQSTLEKASGRVAVLGIDLDRFKEINDQLGHAVGDIVLQQFGQRISAELDDGEFLARFGGDEFAAFKSFADDGDLFAFIARTENAVKAPFTIDQNEVFIGASIGVAIYPDDGTTAEKLISNADMAMYRAKESLTERVCYYEPDMDEVARDRRLMARDLWDAASRGQLLIKYQVQKSVATGVTIGYEALLRWQHPERGMVSPVDFIPVAEECGAILPIGEWVLRNACLEASQWGPAIKLAVNISPVQLASSNLVDIVSRALADSGLHPNRLELEVTESAIIADKERALHALRQIKSLGVTIAIDDFGTGYSSLETLRSFPFDKIKLDRSFMTEVETSKQAKAVVRAILSLGRGLEVPVLAEGVETADQLSFLTREGCDEAQGYLLGRPETLPAAADMLKAG